MYVYIAANDITETFIWMVANFYFVFLACQNWLNSMY